MRSRYCSTRVEYQVTKGVVFDGIRCLGGGLLVAAGRRDAGGDEERERAEVQWWAGSYVSLAGRGCENEDGTFGEVVV